MPAIENGRSYRLIGGEELTVYAIDETAGIATVHDTSGRVASIALSAFAGAERLPARGGRSVLDFSLDAADVPAVPARRDTLAAAADDLPADEESDDEVASLGPIFADEPMPGPALEGPGETLLEAPGETSIAELEDALEDAADPADVGAGAQPGAWRDDAFHHASAAGLDQDSGASDDPGPVVDGDGTPLPGIGMIREESVPGDRDDFPAVARPAEPEARHGGTGETAPHPTEHEDVAMHETRQLPLDDSSDDPYDDPEGGSAATLSPLLVGALFGLVLLAGGAMWLVLEGRIDTLQTRLDAANRHLATLAVGAESSPGPALPDPALPARLDALEARIAALPEPRDDVAPAAAVAGLAGRIEELEKRLETVAGTVAAQDKTTRSSPASAPAPVRAPTPAGEPSAAATPSGFVVIIASFPTRDQGRTELARLRAKGVAATLRETRVDGKPWYRVQVEGFSERPAAATRARELATRHGIRNAWVAAAR